MPISAGVAAEPELRRVKTGWRTARVKHSSNSGISTARHSFLSHICGAELLARPRALSIPSLGDLLANSHKHHHKDGNWWLRRCPNTNSDPPTTLHAHLTPPFFPLLHLSANSICSLRITANTSKNSECFFSLRCIFHSSPDVLEWLLLFSVCNVFHMCLWIKTALCMLSRG